MTEKSRAVGIEHQLLQCLQCNTQFDEEDRLPTVLPCLHTLCTSCLPKFIKDNILQCPKCGHKHESPDNSTEAFSIDYTRRDLVEFFNNFCLSKEVMCGMCEEKKQAKNWCRNCETFLCATCRNIHKNNRIFKSHNVVDNREIKHPLNFPRVMFCSRDGHSNIPISIYCTGDACKKPVCTACWIDDHKNPEEHSQQDIKEKFNEEMNMLKDKATETHKLKVELGKLQDRIDEETSDIRKQTIKAEFEITSYFNRCIRLLEKRKMALLENLNTVAKDKQKNLRSQKIDIEHHKRNMSDAEVFFEQSCLSKNPAAFLHISSTMNNRFEDLCNTKYDQSPKVIGDIAFNSRNKGTTQKEYTSIDLEKSITEHGELLSSNVYPPNTEIVTIKASTDHDNNQIQVSLKDYMGNEIDDKYVILSAKMTEKSSGERIWLGFRKCGHAVFKSLGKLKRPEACDFRIFVNRKYFKDFAGIRCSETATDQVEEETDTYDERATSEENEEERDTYDKRATWEDNELFGCEEDYTDCDVERDLHSESSQKWGSVESVNIEESSSIIIHDFSESTTEDDIKEHFNDKEVSGEENISSIQINKEEGWCVVKFPKNQVAKDVARKNHKLNGRDLSVTIHDKNVPTAPGPVKITRLDKNKLSFLLSSDASRDMINTRLDQLSAKLEWPSDTEDGNSLIVACTLTTDTRDFRQKAAQWVKRITRAICEFFEVLDAKEQKIKSEEWDVILERIKAIEIPDDGRVMIKAEKTQLNIVVIGYKSQFMEVYNHLNVITQTVIVQERLEHFKLKLLTSGNLLEKIKIDHKMIKIIPDVIRNTLEFSGTAVIVSSAKQEVDSILKKVVSRSIPGFSNAKVKFVQKEAVQIELENQFKTNQIVGSCSVHNDNTVKVHALSKYVVEEAVKIVKMSVKEIVIENQVQPSRIKLNKEKIAIKGKTGEVVDIITTSENKIIIFGIPENVACSIEAHIRVFLKHPDGPLSCTAHFSTPTGQIITTIVGDITDMETDVLLCSSDRVLKLGIGVGKSLVTKGGKEVQEECQHYLETKPQKQLDVGELFYSSSGTLKFKMVAHIPGKKWKDKHEISEKEKNLSMKMVTTALVECGKKKYESVAIPALCSGNNEFPVKISTRWIVEAINEFLKTNGKQTSIRNIYLCDINRVAVDAFVKTLATYFDLVY